MARTKSVVEIVLNAISWVVTIPTRLNCKMLACQTKPRKDEDMGDNLIWILVLVLAVVDLVFENIKRIFRIPAESLQEIVGITDNRKLVNRMTKTQEKISYTMFG